MKKKKKSKIRGDKENVGVRINDEEENWRKWKNDDNYEEKSNKEMRKLQLAKVKKKRCDTNVQKGKLIQKNLRRKWKERNVLLLWNKFS